MYEGYFGLSERPFSIAPDPQYLYMSFRHKEAMAHLSYGLSQGGCFIVLTGEVGTGKTTLCRNLLTDLPDDIDIALILNANINETELLQTVCDELKIEHSQSSSQKQLLDLINQHLLATFANNRHTVLIIDEAQLLSRDVLEQVRLLTNLETTKNKLLQIILIGQPELNDLLARNDLRQLAQRVTARYHLGALQRNEIEEYVNFRLGVAGCKQPLFSKQALNKLHQLSEGIPRKINVLADHALLAAYSKNQTLVDSPIVTQAAKDVFIETAQTNKFGRNVSKWWVLAGLFLALNLTMWLFFSDFFDNKEQEPTDEVRSSKVNELLESKPLLVIEPKIIEIDETKVTQAKSSELKPTEPKVIEGQVSENKKDEVIIENEEVSNAVAQQEMALADEQTMMPGKVIISEELLDAGTDVNTPVPVIDLMPSNDTPLIDISRNPTLANENRSFGDILETSADLTGRITAFRNLTNQWQATLPEKILQPACQAVSQLGLQCLDVSTLEQLKRYNRPAILVLRHKDQLHRVIIQSLGEEFAQVQLGPSIYQLPVDELASRWTNRGVLFWQPSDAGISLQTLGDEHSKIPKIRLYLNQALAQADLPILKSVESWRFDVDMSQKVFALQTRYSLLSDSKIGNETYLLMNELVAPNSTLVLNKRTP